MTLDEAIKEYENMAKYHTDPFSNGKRHYTNKIMTENFSQLVEWLKELKQLREQIRWIPVSERTPKAGERVGNAARYYLVQNEYGDMLVARYTHSGYWEQIYQLKPCADEIVAWKSLPLPYEAESEVEE